MSCERGGGGHFKLGEPPTPWRIRAKGRPLKGQAYVVVPAEKEKRRGRIRLTSRETGIFGKTREKKKARVPIKCNRTERRTLSAGNVEGAQYLMRTPRQRPSHPPGEACDNMRGSESSKKKKGI